MTTATGDVHGMVTDFKVNRPLSEQEKTSHLAVKKKHSNEAHYALSLLKVNSTFAESVDKFYGVRGFVAMGGGSVAIMFLGALIAFSTLVDENTPYWFYFVHVASLGMIGVATYLFTRDAFTYTHYPIRFNRKNRSVYVWRRDGTVLKAAWDSLYFTIYGHSVGFRDLYVVGHVLAEDRNTVKETFALSMCKAGVSGEGDLRTHFEFYRRYMEQGLSSELLDHTRARWLPPLYERRESYWWGLRFQWSSVSAMGVFALPLAPLLLMESLFRWVAMRTSKIPVWPEWVEVECAIEPGDPWVRDAHRH